MPTTSFPIDELSIWLLQRGRRRYPRFEWRLDAQRYAACVSFWGHSAAAPHGELAWPEPLADLNGLTEAAKRVLADDGRPAQGMGASALLLDFETRSGAAIGAFWAYQLQDGALTTLHDHSIAAVMQAHDASQAHDDRSYCLPVDGILLGEEPTPGSTFWFAGRNVLLCTSFPLMLHRQARSRLHRLWPIYDHLMAEAMREYRDAWIAIWNPERVDVGFEGR